jgi:hypothetical protein
MTTDTKQRIQFPQFSGLRCLMMPYIQGDFNSVPPEYSTYKSIIESVYIRKGDIGFLTVDESKAIAGKPHRGQRAKFNRALHTEAGIDPDLTYAWGGAPPTWGGRRNVILDRDVKVLLANNLNNSCALWDAEHENTSIDGDIGEFASDYPFEEAIFMQAGEIHEIGILTPHESMPVDQDFNRQFLRIVSSGVHGREEYFTENPIFGSL